MVGVFSGTTWRSCPSSPCASRRVCGCIPRSWLSLVAALRTLCSQTAGSSPKVSTGRRGRVLGRQWAQRATLCLHRFTSPAGVICRISIFGTHHNPAVWPDPEVLSLNSPVLWAGVLEVKTRAAKSGLDLTLWPSITVNLRSTCFHLLSVGMTGGQHHAWLMWCWGWDPGMCLVGQVLHQLSYLPNPNHRFYRAGSQVSQASLEIPLQPKLTLNH